MKKKLYIKFEDLDNHNEVMQTFFMLCSKLTQHYAQVGQPIGLLGDFVLRGCIWFGELARVLELDSEDDMNDHNQNMENDDDK